jgi:hypothetical protein
MTAAGAMSECPGFAEDSALADWPDLRFTLQTGSRSKYGWVNPSLLASGDCVFGPDPFTVYGFNKAYLSVYVHSIFV